MVKIYCQYSYGGFKTFFIEGNQNEELNHEVTLDNDYGFPKDAHRYFQYGGAKVVYRYLSDGRLLLAIREIPSIHVDGDGRSIPCAVQFIADKEDRALMDYLALDILNDVKAFEDFFSKLFRVRQGLRIAGDKLVEYINNHNTEIVYDTDVPQLRNISQIESGVILFVHLSNNFGVDERVTRNVCGELGFDMGELKSKGCFMSNVTLSKIQGQTAITAKPVERIEPLPPDPQPVKDDSETLRQLIVDLRKENAELKNANNDCFEKIKALKAKIEQLKDLNEKNNRRMRIGGIIIIGLGILSLISMCSSGK